MERQKDTSPNRAGYKNSTHQCTCANVSTNTDLAEKSLSLITTTFTVTMQFEKDYSSCIRL